MSSQHVSKGTNFFLQPWDKNKDSTFIDQSLAKAIGRSYSKALCAEWENIAAVNANPLPEIAHPTEKLKTTANCAKDSSCWISC